MSRFARTQAGRDFRDGESRIERANLGTLWDWAGSIAEARLRPKPCTLLCAVLGKPQPPGSVPTTGIRGLDLDFEALTEFAHEPGEHCPAPLAVTVTPMGLFADQIQEAGKRNPRQVITRTPCRCMILFPLPPHPFRASCCHVFPLVVSVTVTLVTVTVKVFLAKTHFFTTFVLQYCYINTAFVLQSHYSIATLVLQFPAARLEVRKGRFPTAWEHPLISACVRKMRKPQNLRKVRKRHRFQIMSIMLLVTVTSMGEG